MRARPTWPGPHSVAGPTAGPAPGADHATACAIGSGIIAAGLGVDPHMDITVRTDLDGGLSTATADGIRAGRLGFRIDRDHDGTEIWTVYTTVVDPRYEGQGVGSALVRDIIAHAERAGALVDPTCWFVAGWLDRHPEYHHMLIDDLR